MDLIKKQLNRRSERGLDPKREIPEEIIKNFKNVINASATSINGQGASAIFIQDKEMIEKISVYNWNQEHIKKAPLFILFVGDMNRTKYAFEKNGISDWKLDETNFNELLLVGAVDATIKAQAVVDAALDVGMGSCYIGGVRTFSDKLINDLNLPDYVFPIVGLTIGYIETQQGIKPKINTVYNEKYNNKQMKEDVDKYDDEMEKYFQSRAANKKKINWSSGTAKSYGSFFAGDLYSSQDELIKTKFKSKK